MLQQFIGSIKGYLYDKFPVDIYEKELPETIKVPSMYFPQPNILHLPYSKESYEVNYTINVQILHKDSPSAMEIAENIAQSIRKNWNKIPLLDEEGNKLDGFILFNSVESERMEEGIVELRLEWDYEFHYN